MGLGYDLHDILTQVVLGCAFILIVCLSWCACQSWCVEVDYIWSSCRRKQSTTNSEQTTNLTNLAGRAIPQVIVTMPSPAIQHLLPAGLQSARQEWSENGGWQQQPQPQQQEETAGGECGGKKKRGKTPPPPPYENFQPPAYDDIA